MGIELTGLSRTELLELAGNVEKQLKRVSEDEKKAAIKAARLAVQEHGFDFEELFGTGNAATAKMKLGKAKNPPKYCNPANPEQTWSGRGRRPAWVGEALDAGKSLEDMAI